MQLSSARQRRLLSRLPALRDLRYEVGLISRAVAVLDSLPEDAFCTASLYRLTLKNNLPSFPFAAPPSFRQLTELAVGDTMMEADRQPLLAGCPKLLVLNCNVRGSCQAVLIAARCCPYLLDLTVSVNGEGRQAGNAALAEAEPDVSGHFLPELMALRLSMYHQLDLRPSFGVSSLLRRFRVSPLAQLQRVVLNRLGLTAQHVLSLAHLPRLSYFCVSEVSATAEVDEARRRMRKQLFITRSMDGSQHVPHALNMAQREDCEGGLAELQPPPLGPHQHEEMRQRVLERVEADHYDSSNLLAGRRGVPRDTVRSVFFAELRSVIAATAP